MCESIYITFTSDDYKNTFPDNNGSSFQFKLGRIFEFEMNKWEVYLISFYNKNLSSDDNFVICLDGVIESYIGQQILLPCVGRYPLESSVRGLKLPFRLTRQLFETLHVYIYAKEDTVLKKCSASSSTVQLLFKRICCSYSHFQLKNVS